MSGSRELAHEREAVAAAARELAAQGLVGGTSGNVSVRSGDLVAISPTGASLATLTADAVTVVDLAGTVVDGALAPTSELDIHLGVYRRYDAGAVVHCHPTTATALSTVIDELPCVHYELLMVGGTVRVAPYATFGTPELAASVLEALDGRTACLMANHGIVTYAQDAPTAVRSAELVEWACEVYRRALTVGTPAVLDEAARGAVIEAALRRGYGETRPA